MHYFRNTAHMEIDENIEKKGIKKVKGRLDKILLGVVVGGAVGSILGVTLAPKSGKETRKIIGQKGKNTWKKVSDIMEETMINSGVTKVLGMFGHSNLGFSDPMRSQ